MFSETRPRQKLGEGLLIKLGSFLSLDNLGKFRRDCRCMSMSMPGMLVVEEEEEREEVGEAGEEGAEGVEDKF